MFDYETLRLMWWLLLGVLLAGFAVTDGYDLGVGAILRLIARDDVERRMAIEAIEPHWEGHQVWFVLGGGAVFAAWPLLYGAAFSGFYFAMLLVLLALILRPVGFAFRNKLTSLQWRGAWDWALTIAGAVPSLVFGVAFGNLFLGVPFHYTDSLRSVYDGSFIGLFHPFALLCGVLSLSMLVAHGGTFAAMKIEDPVGARAQRIARIAAIVALVAFIGCGLWLTSLPGHVLASVVDGNGPSNPLHKQVSVVAGGWMTGAGRLPWAWPAAVIAGLGLVGVVVLRARRLAFVASAIAVAAIVFTGGFALFPFLLPSATDPSQGLTVWDASSSKSTLGTMLFATVVLLPLVLAYSTWAFRVMRGQVTRAHVEESEEGY
ncbi:cytochrome D ubiquinol oxidase subunit II [Lysobacter helvus]|uniref:Cytochrome D ubiquinol oxidase subunit II n=2 Tax=Lysobacteraceae TaxID=32033 RepID=A0ABM7Q454_9GAMM|nr:MULTISPECIES: cytochrome d ubiquinol oxidase subunit II [Lysobacter]BCT92046.1 cytochrome D ubiquinol oxidase subunit II [Lysobacter caseinilyticus]BCT95199.1 cytochrome D ubiquinol oxidase subunit II [Lysobacter helvus]